LFTFPFKLWLHVIGRKFYWTDPSWELGGFISRWLSRLEVSGRQQLLLQRRLSQQQSSQQQLSRRQLSQRQLSRQQLSRQQLSQQELSRRRLLLRQRPLLQLQLSRRRQPYGRPLLLRRSALC